MGETAYERIFRNNREWVERTTREDGVRVLARTWSHEIPRDGG